MEFFTLTRKRVKVKFSCNKPCVCISLNDFEGLEQLLTSLFINYMRRLLTGCLLSSARPLKSRLPLLMSSSLPSSAGKKPKQATLARFFTSMKNKPTEGTPSPKKSSKHMLEDRMDNVSGEEEYATKKLKQTAVTHTVAAPSSMGSNFSSIPSSAPSSGVADSPQQSQRLVGEVEDALSSNNNDHYSSNIPYSEVCEVFNKIEAISSRLEIIRICSDFFIKIMKQSSKNLIPTTYLFINRLGPDYEAGLELGLGENLLMKTISETCGKSMSQIKLKYKDIGDLGEIAMGARNVQPTMFKPKPLTVGEVFKNLRAIAKTQGKDSQLKKMKLIKRMLTACKGIEAKFLIRSLESKLRIGLAEKAVLISLSKALLLHDENREDSPDKDVPMDVLESAQQKIRDAFCQVPNYEIVINSCLEHGIMNLDKYCTLRPGIPLKPMLAKPTKAINEVLDRFQGETFTSEYKYDGERAQAHLLNDGTMRIYSRNGENMTERYPEINITDFIQDLDTTKNLILDCEAVAWDKDQGKILPFQVLSTRKRKDVELNDVKVKVCLFAFDILCYNDERLINKSLKERREYLTKVTKVVPGEFQYATQITTNNLDELQKFLDESVNHSCEGLMVKMLEGPESHYEPSKRSRNWLKLKKDYLEGVGDSLDLCVLGAYYGRGKRTGTYGGFLLGCYNQDTGEFETCCKIGTGFSDEMLQLLHDRLTPTIIDGPKATFVFDSSAEPDVWFEPTTLFEVLTADLSLSPIYKAGSATFDKGVSLRFPRFLRIREDKGVEDATSSDQIVELYENQSHMQN
ncbi:AFI_G0007190.mRNA.1.CDS.1 [Saccharomyces cerevisiae]|nr:AFI_G0007190.mRNA.1.CDS.1 [Saccharomyces cerevisiae]CAI6533732.1 AFI_G0007190.mRNA.1.CDS.1 [Saccharomyces cerevisiae]